MSSVTTITPLFVRSTEYLLHRKFYQILNIPPCPIRKSEMVYHLRNYLERICSLVTSEDNHGQHIIINKNLSILSGINEGEKHTFIDLVRIVWRRVRLSK